MSANGTESVPQPPGHLPATAPQATGDRVAACNACLADLQAAYDEALLREFVSNEDPRVRRIVVRRLSLRAERREHGHRTPGHRKRCRPSKASLGTPLCTAKPEEGADRRIRANHDDRIAARALAP